MRIRLLASPVLLERPDDRRHEPDKHVRESGADSEVGTEVCGAKSQLGKTKQNCAERTVDGVTR